MAGQTSIFIYVAFFCIYVRIHIWGGTNKESFFDTVRKKIKRLIVPSILFSFLYLYLFQEIPDSIIDGTIMILNGVGHLWFLPMLFWCFVMGHIIQLIKLPPPFKVIMVIVLGVLNFLPIPFRFGEALGYFQYFYIGYLMCPYSEKINNMINKKGILALWGIFLFLFFIIEPLSDLIRKDLHNADLSIINKASHWASLEFIRSIVSWGGLIAFYATSLYYVNRPNRSEKLTAKVLAIGKLCFGAYLFQQFILQFIYYKTTLPQILGLWLPWISFIIALFLSMVFTYLVKLSKIGRQFI